jgi:hypothetical protein
VQQLGAVDRERVVRGGQVGTRHDVFSLTEAVAVGTTTSAAVGRVAA